MNLIEKLKAAQEVARSNLPDALLIGGAASFSVGAGMVYEPAGYIVGGLFALAAGVLLAKKGGK